MMLRRIYKWDQLSKERSQLVDWTDEQTRTHVLGVIQDLEDTLKATGNGVGLAAPQINQLVRIIVIQPNKSLPPETLINPEIIWHTDDKEIENEGCLSFPGVFVPVERFRSVKVRFVNKAGLTTERLFTRFDARIVQHEIDHLDGICRVGEQA